MRRKIIYLINPISGTRGKTSLKELVVSKTKERKIPFEVLPTMIDGDYRFLKSKIKDDGITDIVVCGGDGSVNAVVHSLADMDVNFGIVPMGSGNGLAYAAGIPKNSAKALDIVFDGKPLPTDAFLVNEKFACMLCGLGFDAKVAHEFAEQPKRGLATYASLTTRNFFSAKAYPFKVKANGLSFTTEAFFISVANSNQFGNNFTIAPQAELSDGMLDVVIVKKIAKPLLLLTVLKQVIAGKIKKVENSLRSPVIYFQTDNLVIENIAEAPLHIDGEPRESIKNLAIRILPHHFKLIHPSS
ncbi:MAG TPA: YegS/Rv2252/BmrU family lipid kinase [Pseudobacter sp.]|nr:YegS/Rv2252/BmrU family lipid kinase [Pseudobacter sp.]